MKKEFNAVQGKIGEFDVKTYLEQKKYRIVEQNYKNRLGEIDIIAWDKKCLVFIEVKKRSTLMFGRPSEAVNFKKQQKIKKVASVYLLQKKLTNVGCRFDVVEVLSNEINHIENAF